MSGLRLPVLASRASRVTAVSPLRDQRFLFLLLQLPRAARARAGDGHLGCLHARLSWLLLPQARARELPCRRALTPRVRGRKSYVVKNLHANAG